jgi:hypothetical protein
MFENRRIAGTHRNSKRAAQEQQKKYRNYIRRG